MREFDDLSPIMIALGGGMAGTGTTIIFTELNNNSLASPMLSGGALGVCGALLILSEIYLARQQE